MHASNPADQAQRLRRAIRFQQSQLRFSEKRLAIVGLSHGIGVSALVERIAEELREQDRDTALLSWRDQEDLFHQVFDLSPQQNLILDLGTNPPPVEILPTLDWLLVAGRATNEHLLDGYALFKQIADLSALPRLGIITLPCEPAAVSASREMRKRLVASADRFLSLEIHDFGGVPRFPSSLATSAVRWRPVVRGILKTLGE